MPSSACGIVVILNFDSRARATNQSYKEEEKKQLIKGFVAVSTTDGNELQHAASCADTLYVDTCSLLLFVPFKF